MNYIFFLKNEKTKKYRLISQLLILFNLLGFVFLLINDETSIKNNLWLMFAILVTAVYLFFAVIKRIQKGPIHDTWHRFILMFCAIDWSRTEWWWIFFIILLFIGLDYLALRKQVVKISTKNIFLPSLFTKTVEWHELSNVILKDGLLTVDFKNNKLFQQPISDSDWDVDEKRFNDFCKRQLNK